MHGQKSPQTSEVTELAWEPRQELQNPGSSIEGPGFLVVVARGIQWLIVPCLDVSTSSA